MNKKMRIPFLIAIVLFVFGVTSCKKNGSRNDSDLTITFQTKLGSGDYKLTEGIQNNAATFNYQFELFQFYLSDIILVNSDDEERLASEIALFKLNSNGYASLDVEVPRGKYKSVKFGLGVKKELNEADPSNYSEKDHPLNTSQNTYWGWASMYRFISVEGRYDADLNNEFEGTFAYHTGYEDSYEQIVLSHDFEIDKKEANFLAFEINITKVLDNSGGEINVPDESNYHGGLDNFYLADQIGSNLKSAISLVE